MQNNKNSCLFQGIYKDAEDYFLSSRETVPANTHPKLIFVFSSPGVGKSQTIKPILNKSFSQAPVNLEIDELKTFISNDVKNKTAITDAWFQKILNKAMNQRLNVVVFRQRNLLQLNQTRHILTIAKKMGYTTEISFVALDVKKSRLSLFDRYEKALDNKTPTRENYPRKPDILRHYIFYKALPIALNFCSKLKQTDIINVYNRNGELLSFINKQSRTASEISPAQALRLERERVWTAQEKTDYNNLRTETLKQIKQRRVFKDVLKFKFSVKHLDH